MVDRTGRIIRFAEAIRAKEVTLRLNQVSRRKPQRSTRDVLRGRHHARREDGLRRSHMRDPPQARPCTCDRTLDVRMKDQFIVPVFPEADKPVHQRRSYHTTIGPDPRQIGQVDVPLILFRHGTYDGESFMIVDDPGQLVSIVEIGRPHRGTLPGL